MIHLFSTVLKVSFKRNLIRNGPKAKPAVMLYGPSSNYSLAADEDSRRLPKNTSDLSLRLLSQGLRKHQMPLSWLNFKRVYEEDKTHLVTNEQLSNLLRMLKFPNWYKASQYTIATRINAILDIMLSRGYLLEEEDLRHLVANFAAMERFSEAKSYWEKLCSLYPIPSIDSFSAYAFLHLQENNPGKVIEILSYVKSLGLQRNQAIRFHALQAYGMLSDVEKILDMFQEISDNNPDQVFLKDDNTVMINQISSKSYIKLFKALSFCESVPASVFDNLFEMMIQGRVSPKEDHFYHIMFFCCRTQLPRRALETFLKMRAVGIQPTIKKYINLLYMSKKTNFPELFIPELTDPEYDELMRILTTSKSKKVDSDPVLEAVSETEEPAIAESPDNEGPMEESTEQPLYSSFFHNRVDAIRKASRPEVMEPRTRRPVKQYVSLDI